MTVSCANSDIGTRLALRKRMRRVHQQHQLVRAERHREQPLVARIERDDAEVEAALRDLDADLARRHAAHVHENARMLFAEFLDQRQQHVHAALVRSDQHASALQVPQLADGQLRLLRQPLEPLGVVAQHPPRLGQRAVLRRAIEQPLPHLVLEPADGLADGRLGAVQLRRGARKAALGGHGEKYTQFCQFHAGAL